VDVLQQLAHPGEVEVSEAPTSTDTVSVVFSSIVAGAVAVLLVSTPGK
jgi:hypothetical protein